jgi:hypothetical protein
MSRSRMGVKALPSAQDRIRDRRRLGSTINPTPALPFGDIATLNEAEDVHLDRDLFVPDWQTENKTAFGIHGLNRY